MDIIDLSKKVIVGCLNSSNEFGAVYFSQFTHNGSYFVAVSGYQLTIWETTEWKQIYTEEGGSVSSLSFDQTDSFLFIVESPGVNPDQNIPEIRILDMLPFQIHIYRSYNIVNVIVLDGVHYLIMDTQRSDFELVNQFTNTVEGILKLGDHHHVSSFIFDDYHSELIALTRTMDGIEQQVPDVNYWIRVWEIKGMKINNRLTLSTNAGTSGLIRRNGESGYLCCAIARKILIWH